MALAPRRLVVGAVQFDQGTVDEGLLSSVQTNDGFADFGIDVLNGLQHALSQIARFVAITQFQRLPFRQSMRRTVLLHGPLHRFQQYIGFNSRITARIQDFASNNVNNRTHNLNTSDNWLIDNR